MGWIDYLIARIVLVTAVSYAMRGREGASIAIFDAAAFVVTAWTCHTLWRRVSTATGLSPTAVYVIIFVIVGFLLLIASARLSSLADFNLTPFNTIAGFIFGFVAGWAICFALLDELSITARPKSPLAQVLTASKFAPEILNFRTITGGKARLDSTMFRSADTMQQ
jgi:uncharacterized membrane protein required for colicin V production